MSIAIQSKPSKSSTPGGSLDRLVRMLRSRAAEIYEQPGRYPKDPWADARSVAATLHELADMLDSPVMGNPITESETEKPASPPTTRKVRVTMGYTSWDMELPPNEALNQQISRENAYLRSLRQFLPGREPDRNVL